MTSLFRLLPVLAVSVLLLTSGCKQDSPTAPQNENRHGLYFSPEEATVGTGEPLTLDVRAGEWADSVFAVSFELPFDSAVLTFSDLSGIQAGDFFGYEALVFAQDSAGTLHVALSRMQGQNPVTGTGTLASLRFIGRAAGTCELALLPERLHWYSAAGAEITSSRADTLVAVIHVN
jgi:hypothetical protein